MDQHTTTPYNISATPVGRRLLEEARARAAEERRHSDQVVLDNARQETALRVSAAYGRVHQERLNVIQAARDYVEAVLYPPDGAEQETFRIQHAQAKFLLREALDGLDAAEADYRETGVALDALAPHD